MDRDGTIMEELGYLSDPGKVRLIPGAAGSIHELNKRRIPVVVVSNQAGVARGIFGPEDLEKVNARFVELLAQEGASVDAVYYCPHHPDFDRECDCRKPAPGMLLKASAELGISLPESYIVGDRLTDLQAGRAAGLSTILVLTGYGGTEMEENARAVSEAADGVCEDLARAVARIMSVKLGD